MDSSIRLPGGYRIGWDGVIGLVPGFGDLFGLVVSGWIVFGTARLGVPRRVLMRMLLNVAIESVLGTIPVIGDVFDFVFKANERNLRLAALHLENPALVRQRSTRDLAIVALALVGALLVVGWLLIAMVGLVISFIGALF